MTKKPTKQALQESKIKDQLKIIKENIHTRNQEQNTYYCQGCLVNGYTVHLDCSHILSVKQCKRLELDHNNIQLLCRKCHSDWESWNIQKMIRLLCFKSNLNFIKQNDTYRFNKITFMLEI